MSQNVTRTCLFALAAVLTLTACTQDTKQPKDRYVCRFEHSGSEPTSCGLESEFGDDEVDAHHAGMHHGMAMYEIDRYHGQEPTPEQQQAAEDLIRRSYESAEKNGWFDFEKGSADGYKRLHRDPIHFVNKKYIFDDHVLDPERPEYLMYYNTSQGPKLVAFMFVPQNPRDEGPQIGGPLTRWHYHRWSKLYCLLEGMMTVGYAKDGKCKEGIPTKQSPEMMHVWLLDTPFGPFGKEMDLPLGLVEKLVKQREEGR